MDKKYSEEDLLIMHDEKGKSYELVIVDEVELDGVRYFIVAESKYFGNDDCEYEIVKEIMEDGQPVVVGVDDDDEFDRVADYYDDLVASEVDYDA